MKFSKILIILFILASVSFTSAHKYYLSVTDIEYVKEKESVQIITRIFIDDFERLLRQRYDKNITLNVENESNNIDKYIEKYLTRKIKISINDNYKDLIFIGKEYKEDMVVCYLEIDNVNSIASFKITNNLLYDVFDDQKNMIKTHINSKHKNFILTKDDDKGYINY